MFTKLLIKHLNARLLRDQRKYDASLAAKRPAVTWVLWKKIMLIEAALEELGVEVMGVDERRAVLAAEAPV